MGATLTVNQGSTQMVRLVGDKLVQEEAQRNLYIVPPKGEYEFQITGYALPFEMQKAEKFIKPGEKTTQTMTRIEFTITGSKDGKGVGRMWSELIGFSIGERSNLGKLLRKLNVDLEPDANGTWDLDRAIGYKGKGYVVPSDTLDEQGKPKWARLSLDTVEPVSAPDRAYTITIVESEPTTNNNNGNGHQAATDDGWE